MPDMKNGKTCLGKDCQNPAVRRGLCEACYQVCYKLTHTKQTSWEKLEAAGLTTPTRRGRKAKQFLDALKKK